MTMTNRQPFKSSIYRDQQTKKVDVEFGYPLSLLYPFAVVMQVRHMERNHLLNDVCYHEETTGVFPHLF